jgi:hypothetical protein
MPQEILPMRKIRDGAAKRQRFIQAEDRSQPRSERESGRRLHPASARGGRCMPLATELTDAALERSFIGLQLRSRSDGRSQTGRWSIANSSAQA